MLNGSFRWDGVSAKFEKWYCHWFRRHYVIYDRTTDSRNQLVCPDWGPTYKRKPPS